MIWVSFYSSRLNSSFYPIIIYNATIEYKVSSAQKSEVEVVEQTEAKRLGSH